MLDIPKEDMGVWAVTAKEPWTQMLLFLVSGIDEIST